MALDPAVGEAFAGPDCGKAGFVEQTEEILLS